MNVHTRKPIPYIAFYVGGAVHRILEAQIIMQGKPDIPLILDDIETEAEERYREIIGVGWSTEERDLMRDGRDLASSIAEHYFRHWGTESPLGEEFEYLQAEITFRVPIPNTEHHLIGTIDGIAKHESGEIYIVEHKTTSARFPSSEDLQIARQLQVYTWAARELLGYPISGAIYDGILKKVPSIPNVLKDGSLSRAPISTTRAVYRLAIQALGLREEDYLDMLAKLSDDTFFRRHVVRYTEKALDLFTGQLRDVVNDMANPNLPIYPNVVWTGCWDCRFRDLCTATQLGEDITPILDLNYVRAELSPSRSKDPITRLEIEE